MANSTPAQVKIEFDTSGGSLVDISQYILTINEVSVEQMIEEVHTFGDSWMEQLPIGIGKMDPITLGGLYENTATSGPNALFAISSPETPSSSSRTFKMTFITSGNNVSVETWRVNYKRQADRNNLTKFTATIQPTGAVTESTA